MGHLDYFSTANNLLATKLGYRLHPDHADSFRARLRQIGYRRFLAALTQTLLDTPGDPQEAHCLLEANMYALVPHRPVYKPLRNPQAQSARATAAAMDARVMELVGDPRQ